MKQHIKLIIGLLIALVSIGTVCVLALRYFDVLLQPVVAMRKILDKRTGNEDIDDCDCADCQQEQTI